jgi:hypothetical protein
MRPDKCVGLECPESAAPKASAKVYDFAVRRTESRRQRRIRALEHENALLTRVVSETRTEILRLREFLAAS